MELKGDLSKKPRHLIQVVGRRTGISSDVIRAWERRYGAVISQRTDTNRRLYTDDDIEKLTLLKRAINAGRRIGDIANLSYDDLFELVMGDESNTARSYTDQVQAQLWSFSMRHLMQSMKWTLIGSILPCRTPLQF